MPSYRGARRDQPAAQDAVVVEWLRKKSIAMASLLWTSFGLAIVAITWRVNGAW